MSARRPHVCLISHTAERITCQPPRQHLAVRAGLLVRRTAPPAPLLTESATQCRGLESRRSSITGCACSAGFYEALDSNNTRSCFKCDDEKMVCSTSGQKIAALDVLPGMWRPDNETSGLLPCFNPSACVGAQRTNVTSSRRRRLSDGSAAIIPSSTYGDGLCVPGHRGAFCAVCVEGYIGYTDVNLCTECGANLGFTIFVMIVIAIILILAVIFLIRGGNKAAEAMQASMDIAEAMGDEEALEELAVEKVEEVVEGAETSEDFEVVGPVLMLETKRQKTRRLVKEAASKGTACGLRAYKVW